MFKQFLGWMLLLALAVMAADARSHKKRTNPANGTPGVFDYYLLTLSWAPDFCDMNPTKGNARECGSGNHVGFIVHGLWPQYNNGGYPDQCAPASPVSGDIINRMLPLMMDPGLIQHEWRAHGTCSGMNAADYFGAVVRAYQSVQIPPDYKGLSKPIQVNAGSVEAKFAQSNPAFPQGTFHVACVSGELTEVRICLSKDLKAQACSINDCSTGQLKMLPLR